MNSSLIQRLYGFKSGSSFYSTFSKTSFEYVLFDIIAKVMYRGELIFDNHVKEIDAICYDRPGTLGWYVKKTLNYMHGYELIEDDGEYDISRLSEDEIKKSKIVKYASAQVIKNVLYIKVRGNGQEFTQDEKNGIINYIKLIKYAGVIVELINEIPQHFKSELTVYYNQSVLNENGISFINGNEPVRDAIKNYIQSLPFDSIYKNIDLMNVIDKIDGVEVARLKLSEIGIIKGESIIFEPIDAYVNPHSGWMIVANEDDLKITYTPYISIDDSVEIDK